MIPDSGCLRLVLRDIARYSMHNPIQSWTSAPQAALRDLPQAALRDLPHPHRNQITQQEEDRHEQVAKEVGYPLDNPAKST
jgi:hypothetical protein